MRDGLISLAYYALLGAALVSLAWFGVRIWAPRARARGGLWTLELNLLVGGPLSAVLITLYPVTSHATQSANRALTLLCLVTAALAVLHALRTGIRQGVAPVVAVVVAFYGVLVLSGLSGATPGVIPEVYWSTPLVLLAFLVQRDVTWDWFARLLRLTLRITMVLSFAMVLALPGLGYNTQEPRTLFGVDRIQGITGHPNTLAILALVGLLFEVVNGSWGWAAVMVAALLFCQSHTVWISAGLALACLRNPFARVLRAVVVVVLVIGLGVALFDPGFYTPIIADLGGESGFTLNGRTEIWAAALHGFTLYPWLGYGPGLLGDQFRAIYLPDFQAAAQSHDQWIQSLSGTGLVGLGTLIAFAVFVLVAGAHRRPATAGLSLAVPVAFLLRSVTETPLDPFGPNLGTVLILAVLAPIAFTAPSEQWAPTVLTRLRARRRRRAQRRPVFRGPRTRAVPPALDGAASTRA